MKSDFSRISFDPARQYTRVLQQQGRVQTDADLNEHAAIHAHFHEALAASLTGMEGAIFTEPTVLMPLRAAYLPGFRIVHRSDLQRVRETSVESKDGGDVAAANAATELLTLFDKHPVWISPGHYYADGLRCESDAWVPLDFQPHLPKDFDMPPDKPEGPGDAVLFYLDAWERPLSWLDEPRISDIALGPAVDTTMRAALVWQVRFVRGTKSEGKTPEPVTEEEKLRLEKKRAAEGNRPKAVMEDHPWLRNLPWLRSRPRLRVRIKPGHQTGDPCRPAFASGWQGLENQLYRVEIHTPQIVTAAEKSGDPDVITPPTFKWSRENGSVVALVSQVEGTVLRIFPGQLKAGGFQPGDWLEVVTRDEELTSTPGAMVRVSKVRGDSITLEENSARPAKGDKLRRWDQRPCDHGVISVKGGWLEIEGGIEISFEPSEDPPTPQDPKNPPPRDWSRTDFANGDYWVFTARTATGEVDWPQKLVPEQTIPGALSARFSGTDLEAILFGEPVAVRGEGPPAALAGAHPAAVFPHGVRHRYALLASVTAGKEGWMIEDLRRIFSLCERTPAYRKPPEPPPPADGTLPTIPVEKRPELRPGRDNLRLILERVPEVRAQAALAKTIEKVESEQIKAIATAPRNLEISVPVRRESIRRRK